MDYKSKLQTNNTTFRENNTDLQAILDTINSLPNAGNTEAINLDTEITEQEGLIDQIQAALEGKAVGSVEFDTCTLEVYSAVGYTVNFIVTVVNNGTIGYYEYIDSGDTNTVIENVLCGSPIVFTPYGDGFYDGCGVWIDTDEIKVSGNYIVATIPNRKNEIIDIEIRDTDM